MPNTIPAAGEAMPEVTLEAMIARHNAALAAANNCNGGIEDSPEEAELHAAVEAFVDSTAKLTSYAGVLDALRLAAKENEDFCGSEINITLVKGVLAYLEGQSAKQRLADILEDAGKIIRDNPDLMIDHVTVNTHGIYTAYNVPGVEEHPWIKARRLMKELSATLDNCDDAKWSAYVMPPRPPVFNGFAAYPMGQKPDELPVDHVERLSWELSDALTRYQNGAFQAVVLPSSSAGHTVMLTKVGVFDLRAKA